MTDLPIAREGLVFVVPSVLLSLLFLGLGVYPLAVFTGLACLFFLFFFCHHPISFFIRFIGRSSTLVAMVPQLKEDFLSSTGR